MAATFDETLATDKDRIRFYLGDVTNLPAGAILSDEAINAELAAAGSLPVALVSLARGLVSRYAQRPDSLSISGEFSISWKERIGAWNALIAEWQPVAGTATGGSGFASVAAIRPDTERAEYVRGPFD